MSEDKKKKARRSELKKRTFGGISEADIVGYFAHQKVNPDITIKEHKVASSDGCPVMYTVNPSSSVDDNVIEIGRELNSMSDGFDYAIAAVNKRTGETQYRPARLFQFEAMYSSDKKITLGEKRKAAIDYNKSYGITKDEWAQKRSELTEQFGSSVKKRIAEANVRRTVKEDVLSEMVKTSFASTTVISNKKEVKESDISLIQKAESSILPPAIQTGITRDIYPLSLFITTNEIETLRPIAEEVINTSRRALLEKEYHEAVIKTCPDYGKYKKGRAVGFAYLACLAGILNKLTKNNTIEKKVLLNLPFDHDLISKAHAEFMPSEYSTGMSTKAAPRLMLNTEQKQRFIAYTLALALTISPDVAIPLTPWQSALNIPPTVMNKLLISLGCTIINTSPEEAVSIGSLQIAKLTKPPALDKKPLRKIRR